jgi:hypothetical protein
MREGAQSTIKHTVSGNILDLGVHDGGHIAKCAENDKTGVPIGARVEYSNHQRVSVHTKYSYIIA